MKSVQIKKLVIAAALSAFAVVCSPLSVPIGTARCFPVQHLINIIGGVFLGPWYSVSMAFVTSLIRNLLGTGTLLAFPGSMCGALIGGLLYKYTEKITFAYIGELFGTSVIGGLFAYPVSAFILGKDAALLGFIIPFFVSSAGGTVIAVFITAAMNKAKVFNLLINKKGEIRGREK